MVPSPATAWKSIAKVVSEEPYLSPNCLLLFKGGDVWNSQSEPNGGQPRLTLNTVHGATGAPIVFASSPSYGNGGLAVIDGQGTMDTCVSANQSLLNGEGSVTNVTVMGFESKNTTQYGMDFIVKGNGAPMTGLIVAGNYVHNTGPFVVQNGQTLACDNEGDYRNQLDFEDQNGGTQSDGFTVMNNKVEDCGGHNCIQVHYDAGSPVVSGNIVGSSGTLAGVGCNHYCIDVKGVSGGMVMHNTVTCPNCQSNLSNNNCQTVYSNPNGQPGGYYIENIYLQGTASVTFENNIAYDLPLGFQVETGDAGSQNACTNCFIDVKAYNNTTYKLL